MFIKFCRGSRLTFSLLGHLPCLSPTFSVQLEETKIQSFLIYPCCDGSSNVTFKLKYKAWFSLSDAGGLSSTNCFLTLPVRFTHFISHSSAPEVGRAAEDVMGAEEAQARPWKGKQRGEAGIAGEKSFGAGCVTEGGKGGGEDCEGPASPTHDISVFVCCRCPCSRNEVRTTLHRGFTLTVLMP